VEKHRVGRRKVNFKERSSTFESKKKRLKTMRRGCSANQQAVEKEKKTACKSPARNMGEMGGEASENTDANRNDCPEMKKRVSAQTWILKYQRRIVVSKLVQNVKGAHVRNFIRNKGKGGGGRKRARPGKPWKDEGGTKVL